MTTINGVTFNMKTLEPVSTHRNIPNEEPGNDESYITDMGYTGLILRMTGYEKTLAKYDEVINEFMKPGSHALIYRTGWQFSVYSTQLVPLLGIGIVDNFFPYELVMLTSNPYRESSSLSCRAKAITANNQEWSAEDMPCNNLLDNWSYELWSDGTSSAPDGWIFASDGGSVAQESSIVKTGTYSAKLTRTTATYCYLEFIISNYLDYAGKTLTLGAWVYAAANGARILIHDGSTTYSDMHPGDSTQKFITVSKTISDTPTHLKVYCRLDSDSIIGYFDGVVLVEGDSIPDDTFIRDIDTDGSVDAVPDIKVTGAVDSVFVVSDPNPISEPGFETINDWTYSEVDTNGTLTGAQDSTYEYEGDYCYRLQLAGYFQQNDYAKVTQNIDLNGIKKISYRHRKINGAFPHQQLLFQVLAGSAIIQSFGVGGTGDSGWVEKSVEINSSEQTLSFRIFSSYGAMQVVDNRNYIDAIVAYTKSPTKDPEIYNTADTTVKCAVSNDILDGAVHRINADGTGHIDYDDDFTTNKYAYTKSGLLNVTYDTVDDELDIADDGYIFWKCDAKYPITGIPTLTTRVNITTGLPTIQISSDGNTWYDITTAIVDDVETVYDLDSTSLHIKESGLTEFYWRYDCVKGAAAACSIKSLELDVDFVTIDVEHPKIGANGVSTFRCDQHADSSMNCIVTLLYRDRSWPA